MNILLTEEVFSMSANNDNNRFGNNFRALREAFGETQAGSAKVVYVKRSNARQPQGEHRHRYACGQIHVDRVRCTLSA